MRRDYFNNRGKDRWMTEPEFSSIVYYNSIAKSNYLIYLDLHEEPPCSKLHYKVKTDFAKRGTLSIPVEVLEDNGINSKLLNIVSEYETYYVPFALTAIVDNNGGKVLQVKTKQILGLFYSDFQDIFNLIPPEVEIVNNVLYHIQSRKVKPNIKSLSNILPEGKSTCDLVKEIWDLQYSSSFYTNFFQSLLPTEEDFQNLSRGFNTDINSSFDDSDEVMPNF